MVSRLHSQQRPLADLPVCVPFLNIFAGATPLKIFDKLAALDEDAVIGLKIDSLVLKVVEDGRNLYAFILLRRLLDASYCLLIVFYFLCKVVIMW